MEACESWTPCFFRVAGSLLLSTTVLNDTYSSWILVLILDLSISTVAILLKVLLS